MEHALAMVRKDLLADFECPICTRYMLPPINHCQNGHSVCQNCYHRIRRCAVCRAPKAGGRCIILEQIHSSLRFPCAYADEGCDFQGTGDVMSTHQKFCKFSWVPCPLRFNGCEWCGEKSDLVTHCKTSHIKNIFFTSNQKLLSSSFVNRIDRIYYIVFYVFNNIFRCTWKLDKDTGLIRFAVYCLGKVTQQDKYEFQVSYKLEDNEVSAKAPCYTMEDDDQPFLKDRYFVFHYDQLKDLCDDDGDLNYSVNIFKKK